MVVEGVYQDREDTRVAVFVIVYVVMARISSSRFAMALRTLREDERAAAAFGRDIYRLKLKGYVLGAALGGLAGALFAVYLSAFNPSACAFSAAGQAGESAASW